MDAYSTYMKISNNVQNTNTSGNFQFKYFENCDKNDPASGSSNSLKDTCSVNEINIENKLCNSLFNNNTKRKVLVNMEDVPDFNNLIINNKNNNHYINNNEPNISNISNTRSNNTRINNTRSNNTRINNTRSNTRSNNTRSNTRSNNISLNINENI